MDGRYEQQDGAAALQAAVSWWTVTRRDWHLRLVPAPDDGLGLYFARQVHRQATVDEVAASLLADPHVRSALTALSSPAGVAIEQTVLSLWLPEWQAKLLAEGLGRAWKVVLNENRPLWERVDVLIGTVSVVALVGLLAMSARRGTA